MTFLSLESACLDAPLPSPVYPAAGHSCTWNPMPTRPWGPRWAQLFLFPRLLIPVTSLSFRILSLPEGSNPSFQDQVPSGRTAACPRASSAPASHPVHPYKAQRE